MCITYSVLSCKLAARFRRFLSSKMVNHYEVHAIIQDIEQKLQENVLYHLLHYSFLWYLH